MPSESINRRLSRSKHRRRSGDNPWMLCATNCHVRCNKVCPRVMQMSRRTSIFILKLNRRIAEVGARPHQYTAASRLRGSPRRIPQALLMNLQLGEEGNQRMHAHLHHRRRV